MRDTKQVFEDHLQKRLDANVADDIAENFHPDVILLTGTGIYVGHEGVNQNAEELNSYLNGAAFTYQNKLVKDDYAFLEWTAENDEKEVCDGADSFMIKDGKIVFQSIHYSVRNKSS